MDNITHSMAGWALGQAGLKSKTRKGLAALILGANMPDIDVFFGNFPWEPLATHRGFTHGIVGGVLLMPPLLAGLLWLLDRWQVGRGTTFKSGLPMRWGWLVALSYLGAATHPYLDLLTTYSVQLFSPFSNRWYHADGLFIIDLFLWVLLAGTLAWSKGLEQKGREWRRPVQVTIGVVFAYIGLNLLITNRAVASVRSDSPNAEAIFASPPPVFFWRRSLVWREEDCYRRREYDPLAGGAGPLGPCKPGRLGDRIVRETIRRDAGLRKFLRWSVMPFGKVAMSRCSVRVTIGDARYGDPDEGSRLARESVLPTGAPGC